MASLPQFPTIDLSHFDAAKMADKATAVVRDGLYITVGIGVLGAQQVAEFAKQSAVKFQDAVEQAKHNADTTSKQTKVAIDKASKQTKVAVDKASKQAKVAVDKANKQVRSLAGAAA